MSECRRLEEVRAWDRQGAGASIDPALDEHALGCEDCGELLRDVRETRALVADLPLRELADERRDAIRFELMAAARQRKGSPPSQRPPARRGARWRSWPLVAAAVLGVVGVSAVLSLRPAEEPRTPVARSVATVHLGAESEGFASRTGDDEVYVLLRGEAEFAVHKLSERQRYRVVAGDDAIEVRGTRFTVVVGEGRFTRVIVTEGIVELRLRGQQPIELGAGERWARKEPGELAAVSSGAVAPALVAESPASPPKAGAPEATPEAPPTPRSRAAAVVPLPAPTAGAAPADSDKSSHRDIDARFAAARSLLVGGQAKEAARAFDRLSAEPGLDPARRADVLYWAARAHAKAGQHVDAQRRAREVAASGESWHSDEAALLVGESLHQQGNPKAARRWLEQASRSKRSTVQKRAAELLKSGRDDSR